MKTRFLTLAVAAVLFVPSFAQAQVKIESDGVLQTPQKSVRDMTPEERKLLWDSMPEDQKQRIIERRQAAAAEKARVNGWKNLSGGPKAGTGRTAVKKDGSWNTDPSLSAEKKASIQRGAETWNGMTPEQKKAFAAQHQGQIRAQGQTQQNSGFQR